MELLPEAQDSRAEDWYRTTLPEAAAKALRRGGGEVTSVASGGQFILSGLFWHAVLRGSAQGGVYLLQSVRDAARRGSLREFLTQI